MKRVALLVAVLLTVRLAGTPAADAAPSRVDVRNNLFAPADVHVASGETVTWTLIEGTHSVTSDRAALFDSGDMDGVGERFAFRTPRTDVTIYYHCRIHGMRGDGRTWGTGMVGRIVVGAGSPEDERPADVEVRRVPSARWRSLAHALEGLQPTGRYRVELATGRYRSVDLTSEGLGFREKPSPRFSLTIRGSPSGNAVFAGSEIGIGISVDGVTLENLRFERQRYAAVFVRGAHRWAADRLSIERPGRYGVWAEDARYGRVRGGSISGATVAGIAVSGCADCDLLVDSVVVRRSLQGISASGAGSLVVRRSTFHGNGVGVALKASPDGSTRHRGAHISSNRFVDNTARIDPPPLGAAKDMPVGAGVWIDGGTDDVVERNAFSGHSFGVVLTGPNERARVADNTISRSVEADLGWDGVGWDVCFVGNTGPRRTPVTTMPPSAETLYACDLPRTIGVPFPPVTATVIRWGVA